MIGRLAGLGPMLRKEVAEILHTWRWIVLPGLLTFFAVTGPVTAKLAKKLLASVGNGAIAASMPDSTYLDSWQQWTKNITQLGLIVLVATLMGAVSRDLAQGAGVLVLTKPVTRAAFVLAKVVANVALLVVATVLATAITAGLTAALFHPTHIGALLRATAVWLVLAVLMVAISIACSAAFSSGAAAGVAFAVFLVLLVLSAWGPAQRFTPAGLFSAVSRLGAGESASVWTPIGTALVLAAIAVWAGISRLNRREL